MSVKMNSSMHREREIGRLVERVKEGGGGG